MRQLRGLSFTMLKKFRIQVYSPYDKSQNCLISSTPEVKSIKGFQKIHSKVSTLLQNRKSNQWCHAG